MSENLKPYPDYFQRYIGKAENEALIPALESSLSELKLLIKKFPREKENYAYAPGKWTIKKILVHLSDTDRIFAYRALRFARKDPQLLLSYEEDDYAAAADVSNRSIDDLLNEFELVRLSNIALFKSFDEEALKRIGKVPLGDVSVGALGYVLAGHVRHHIQVINVKYL